jgi:hypothetical protein
MTKQDPYYIKKGRVDDDGHIRVVQSSLKIMHNPVDVLGNEACDHDAVAGGYTYPPPSQDANDDSHTSGYYHTGGMLDLVDSMPPSPVSDTTISRLTPEEDGMSSLVTEPTIKPHVYLQLPSPPEEVTGPLEQAADIYSRTLPYASPHIEEQNRYLPHSRSIAPRPGIPTMHKPASTYGSYTTGSLLASLPTATPHVAAPPVIPLTSFAAPAANMTYPYRPISWSGQPILSLPNGSHVGQPIPSSL